MVAITMIYEGDLHCRVQHGPSSATLATDAPKDNHGLGESFSATDLVASALGSCILTIMAIAANRLGIGLEGTTAHVEKTMVNAPTRRIGQLAVRINIPHSIDPEAQTKLERAAKACPVHKSLHPDVKVPMEFVWGNAP